MIFLPQYVEVFVDSGERTYSGTGRNRQTTRLVTSLNNYKSLPLDIQVVPSEGKAMRLTRDGEFLKHYWSRFAERSGYKVLVSGKIGQSCISTKSGGKTVGAVARHVASSGAFLLLPYIDFEAADLWEEREDGAEVWTKTGMEFGQSLLHALLEIDRVLKQDSSANPAPEWALSEEFATVKESKIQQELLRIEAQIEQLSTDKATLKDDLATEVSLRRLLYEKGPGLEAAIIEALIILGFEGSPYKDDYSEFDVVFEANEGRFLGEAEGKDSKAVNVDKLRQLLMNVHEDFEREEVREMARGVLFGNAFRLEHPENRGEFFTEKCLAAARRAGVALVRTTDLFSAAKHVRETGDDAFAKACRETILTTSGDVVAFPALPAKSTGNTKTVSSRRTS